MAIWKLWPPAISAPEKPAFFDAAMTFDRSAGSKIQSSWARVDCWPSRRVRFTKLVVCLFGVFRESAISVGNVCLRGS